MYTIVSVSAARRRFYRLSASRSSSLHKALNLFLSLSEQSLYRVLENSESVMVTVCVCVLCANECLPIINVTKDSPGRKKNKHCTWDCASLSLQPHDGFYVQCFECTHIFEGYLCKCVNSRSNRQVGS